MQCYLTITIDVEPDCSPNWRYSSPLSFDGVSEGIRNRLQPLFNKYEMAPTYLINNVVLEHAPSCEILKSLPGRYELGTHLHPEFIEPEKTEHEYAGKKGEANCCFLPPEIEFEKIKNITRLFTSRFGYAPVSFRAGRFSAGANTIKSLSELGYKIDTSVTPHVNWNDKTREVPVDYTKANEQPYAISPGSYLEEGPGGRMLEIPVTISKRKTSLPAELKRTYFGLRHPIQRERPLWLRPVFSTLQQCISLSNEYLRRYSENEIVIVNMMFHNVEVMPALSPYSETEEDCRAYLQLLESYFTYCRQNNIQALTLSEAYALYQ